MVWTFLVLLCGCGGPEIIRLLCVWGCVMFCGPEIIGILCDCSAMYGLASGEGGSVLIGLMWCLLCLYLRP